ncbi:MAG: hypothetical protein ACK559_38670, partial [bacterium]
MRHARNLAPISTMPTTNATSAARRSGDGLGAGVASAAIAGGRGGGRGLAVRGGRRIRGGRGRRGRRGRVRALDVDVEELPGRHRRVRVLERVDQLHHARVDALGVLARERALGLHGRQAADEAQRER